MKIQGLENKRKEREAKKKKVRRVRWAKILTSIAIFAVLFVAFKSFLNSDFLIVETVSVKGNVKLTEEEILSLANVPPKINIFKVDAAATEKRVKGSPWIKDVKVIKTLPRAISVQIEEEQPVISVKNKDGFWLVSREIVALEKLEKRPNNIPAIILDKDVAIELGYKIKNKMVVQLISIYNSMDKAFKKRITLGSSIGDDMYFMLGKKDVQIVYGDSSELLKKNLVVAKILEDVQKKKMNVYYVDVRVPTKPAIKKMPTPLEIRR